MPAEQIGLVKENYLWKCLLKRENGPGGDYIKVGDKEDFVDKDMLEKAWVHLISALCRAYDKAPFKILQRKIAQTFLRCVYKR